MGCSFLQENNLLAIPNIFNNSWDSSLISVPIETITSNIDKITSISSQEITLTAGYSYINSTSATATTLTIPNMGWKTLTRKNSSSVQYFWINDDRTLTANNTSLDISSLESLEIYLQGQNANPGIECSVTFVLE